MLTLGTKLAVITPSRGYCIELGAAFIVMLGTTQGWPLSTTHCQVGAVIGVGLFEGTGGFNSKFLIRIIGGWVFTLIVVGMYYYVTVTLSYFCSGFYIHIPLLYG
jgi:sodium-dependent phosphate transporter